MHNACFPDKALYLLDAFAGFDRRDAVQEPTFIDVKGIEWQYRSSEEITLLRCRYRDIVIVKKGYVPTSFDGLEGERFSFVNLDMDLYAPTLAALRFFTLRLADGGLILVHDYCHKEFKGIKAAIDEFSQEYPIVPLPIGDDMSVAVVPGCTRNA